MGSIKQNYANNVLTNGKFDATDLDGVIPNTNINDNSIDNITVFGTAGAGIPSVASDPPSASQGDMWYNTTTNTLKYAGVGVASWASGTAMTTARANSMYGGSQTAAIAGMSFGNTNTEIYNGSTWTEVNDSNTGRSATDCGGSTSSAIGAGGYIPGSGNSALCEYFDGTNWTEVGDLTSAKRDGSGGSGTGTSLIIAGGTVGAPLGSDSGATQSWDGTSWTEVNDLNNVRIGGGLFGTSSSAGLFAGGGPSTPTYRTYAEIWNGTSWTEVADLNSGRAGGHGSGVSTLGLIFGGQEPAPAGGLSAKTEEWNGSTWTETNDLSTARAGSGASNTGGTSTAALTFGGETPSPSTSVEVWSLSPFSAKSITTA